ncbi:MAG: hypothetical protein FIB08_03990 [Candidatus Methanoperedens sp.]|nr:hypothetical protein [Candidatus Methanoperedens sp.]
MFSLTFNGKVVSLIVDIKELRLKHHIIIHAAGYAQFSRIMRRGYRMIHKTLVHFAPFLERDHARHSPVISRCKDCARYNDLTCPRDRFWLTFTKEVPSCLLSKNTLPANRIATSLTPGDRT